MTTTDDSDGWGWRIAPGIHGDVNRYEDRPGAYMHITIEDDGRMIGVKLDAHGVAALAKLCDRYRATFGAGIP